LRMPGPLTEVVADESVAATLAALQRRRLASHGRARAADADMGASA